MIKWLNDYGLHIITCRGAENANQQNYDENDRRLSHDVRPSWFVMQKMGKNKENVYDTAAWQMPRQLLQPLINWSRAQQLTWH